MADPSVEVDNTGSEFAAHGKCLEGEDLFGDASVMKVVVKEAPAENTERPAPGDKVYVHYVGTLTSDGTKFDSSRDRGAPFEFSIGSGVIKGWSEAVPTMRVGEIAKFTICPAKAYGEQGSPPTIPPHASLDFEIELLSFTDREDVLNDGTLMRKVLRKNADDWKTPSNRCDVRLTVRDGESVVHVDWPATYDSTEDGPEVNGERLPFVLRKGVHEMKRTELASFLVGDRDYEVEIVSWIENEDCDFEAPEAVVKRVDRAHVKNDNDWKTPNDEDSIAIRGSVWAADGAGEDTVEYGDIDGDEISTETRWAVDEDYEGSRAVDGADVVAVGVCRGVESALKKMKVGEVATVKIAPSHGFETGPLAGKALRARLELVRIEEEAKKTWDMSPDEKIAAVEAKKAAGNAHVKRGDFGRAERRYKAGLDAGASDYDMDDAQKAALKKAVNACKLNRAMCSLKLGKFVDAEKDCKEVLEDAPENTKALFRRGRAQLGLDQWANAKASFKAVLAAEPDNRDAKRGVADILRREKAHKEKEKKLYAGRRLFDRPKHEKGKKAPAAAAPVNVPGPDLAPPDAPLAPAADAADDAGAGVP